MACFGSDLVALRKARSLLDDVFALLAEGSLYQRPIPERHRTVFYVGHVEAFDYNLLKTELHLRDFAPELSRVFAFGIDPGPDSLPSDSPEDWPESSAIADYAQHIRSVVDAVWESVPSQLRHVAIEHRLMHAETLAYMFHNLSHEHLLRPARPESADTGGPVQNELLAVGGGTVVLGRSEAEGFGQDNEFPRTEAAVRPFAMDRWKVSNGEYLEFVKAGAQPPHFWVERGRGYLLRRMFDCIPLPLDWPVWVTHQEAAAYAAWRGCRLPSEAEWHRAAEGSDAAAGNFDARRFDPEPVNVNPGSASVFGIEDLRGNAWEWTSTQFRPFPGFRPFPFYPGYSADFFDDQHYVLKGASPRTDGVFTRLSFRNWFRKDYRYAFAGFRCAR